MKFIGRANAWPSFMGKYQTEQSGERWMPQDVEAAAELAAAALQHDYVDFDRPAFYELLNEPHWSFYETPHLATHALLRR